MNCPLQIERERERERERQRERERGREGGREGEESGREDTYLTGFRYSTGKKEGDQERPLG
jgi:hypothetical protein